MSIQYVGGVQGNRAGATTTTTQSISGTLTGGLASSPIEGDLVIILIGAASAATYTPTTLAVSGWTNGTFRSNTGVTNYSYQQYSYKFMTATPDTSITIPSSGNARNAQRWAVHVFRGVNSTTPLDVTTVFASGTASGRPNPGAITPSTAGAWILWTGVSAAGTGTAFTAPTDFSTNWRGGTTSDTYDVMLGFGYYTGWTTGEYDPAAITTGGTTGATDSWVAETLVLRPSAYNFTSTPSDTTTVSDTSISHSIKPSLSETVVSTDSSSSSFNKIASETATATDSLSYQISGPPQVRYVNTSSTAGGDGTTNNTSGATRAFATLLEALNSLPSALTSQYTIYCSGGADTSNLSQVPFDFTTTATNYLLITTQGDQRHNGVWSDSKYRIESTNENGIYNNIPAHVRFDGLQVKVTVSNGNSYIGIKGSNANQTESDIDCRITNCIVKAVRTNGNVIGFENRPPTGTGSALVRNCIAIDCYSGFNSDWTSSKYYNNGAYDCDYGFVADAAYIVKNCLSKQRGAGLTIGFVGTFSASSSNNAEDDGNGVPGTSGYSNTTFTFVNAASDNFHLAGSDTGARSRGVDLSSDSTYPFNTDIDGETRTGTWDIGPDQYISLDSNKFFLFMQ
jgi:hypothetical protein